jgi:beta-N-acetylhexosaminidase
MVDAALKLGEPPQELRERIAQLIMVRIGSNLPPVVVVDDDEERIAALLNACPVGGLLLFNGTKAGTPDALRRLQARSKVPLLVASDIERGVGQQVRGYTLFPHAAAIGRAASGVESFIATTAREAHEAGIHITFGPVADVSTNPKNPIIAIRAFSDDPRSAAALTESFVSHAEEAGLLSTAKHFPGHGDTHQDSHDSLPSVSKSREELKACELVPFQAAIDAGCSLIMTAHVAFPHIDPSGLPATLSSVLLKELLRDEMGFSGVVCSDSLLMAGVRDLFETEGEMALAALNAGVDLLLDIKEPANVVDYLAECVANGSLTTSRVDEAFDRVWQLKQKAFGPTSAQAASIAEVDALAAREIARGAVEISAAGASVLPFDQQKPLVTILLKPFATLIDPPEQPLAAALQERFANVQYFELGPKAVAAQYEAARLAALAAPQLVVAMIVRPAAWHAFGLLAHQAEFVRELTVARPTVVACLGVPHALDDYPDAAVRICTYSDVAVSQQALSDVLLSGGVAR